MWTHRLICLALTVALLSCGIDSAVGHAGDAPASTAESGNVPAAEGVQIEGHHAHDPPHGHDHHHGHDHAHSHNSDHDHGHDHAHSHNSDHDHSHSHDHDSGGCASPQALGLLNEDGSCLCDQQEHDHTLHHGHSHSGAFDLHRKLSEDEKHPYVAIALTTVSGLAASVGGLGVVMFGVPSNRLLGHMLSFASGIMIYISFCDLLTHAQMYLKSFFWANFWMFAGMAFFGVIVTFIPEPDLGPSLENKSENGDDDHDDEGETDDDDDDDDDDDEPVFATDEELDEVTDRVLGSVAEDKGDVVEYESFRVRELRELCAQRGLPVGGVKGELIERLYNAAAPTLEGDGFGDETDDDESVAGPIVAKKNGAGNDKISMEARKRLMMTGVIAAVGISLHNFPEGLVVFNSTITGVCSEPAPETFSVPDMMSFMSKCMGRGLAVSFAIALHNIPEGMAVAMPIYASTGSKWDAMKWCFLSSICEPAAAIIFGLLFNDHLTPYIMNCLNAAVAGIMIILCFIELIPATLRYISPKEAAFSNVVGQIVMFLSLHFLIEAGAH